MYKNQVDIIRWILFIPAAFVSAYLYQFVAQIVCRTLISLALGQDVDDGAKNALSIALTPLVIGLGYSAVFFFVGKNVSPDKHFIAQIILIVILIVLGLLSLVITLYTTRLFPDADVKSQLMKDFGIISMSLYLCYRIRQEYKYHYRQIKPS